MTSITPKSYAVIAQLGRLRAAGFPLGGLLIAYKALLVPLLTYCISLWGGSYGNVIAAAQVLQNDALRSILGVERYRSVSGEFGGLDILRIDELHRVAVRFLAYKISKQMVNSEVLPPLIARTMCSTRRQTMFETPLAWLAYLRQSLFYKIPATWSSIPRDTRSLPSGKRFLEEFVKLVRKARV